MKFLFFVSLLATAGVARADAVRLQIQGPDGKPVAGAQVRVQEVSGRWFDRKAQAPRDLKSDENGALSLETKLSLAAPKEKFGPQNFAMARVVAPGFAVGAATLKEGDNVIALVPSVALSGVVLDENQQPVAGAILRLTALRFLDDETKKSVALSDDLALETTSDAEGKWRFEALPPGAVASFEARDARYQSQSFDLATSQSAPPIFVRRGVTIRGRILAPDGKGAPDVQFYVGDAQNQPRTDAQGRFEVSGLKPGSVPLQIIGGSGRNLPFFLPFKPIEGLRAGETRDIGDWQALPGVRVKGRVVDAAQKPIEGASVRVWGRGDGEGTTDKTGAFDFPAQPDASVSTISAPGFVQKQRNNVPEAVKGVIDLDITTLQRGQKITGTVKNQAGAPVANVRLMATHNNINEWASSDAKGEFVFDGLEIGTYKIKSQGEKLVSSAQFSVAATGNQPIALVIEGNTPADAPDAPTSTQVEARVTDENGQPVAGAQVALRLKMAGGSYSDMSAISDMDGVLRGIVGRENGEMAVTEVFRPGFVAGKSDLKLENGVWSGQIALQTRGLFLRGRVVDAAGQPLPNVAVGLSTGYQLPVSTGANGEFALADAPQSGVTLFASDGARFASMEVKAGQKVEITLPDAPPADNGALIEAVMPRARWEWGLLENWDAFGAARIEALAVGARRDANNSWSWNQFLQTLARRDPERFVTREAELRAQNTNDNDENFAYYGRLARAAAGDEAQKTEVRNWLESEQKKKRELNTESVATLLRYAEIAARLGDPQQTELWIDYAAQIGDYIPDRGQSAWEWGQTLARLRPDAALRFTQNWPTVVQMQLLQVALGASADLGDEEAVAADWKQIQALAKTAETEPPDTTNRIEGFVIKPSDVLRQTRAKYAQFLSRTDPKAAWEIARQFSPEDLEFAETMPIVGKNAVKLKQFDIARLALRATFDLNMGNTNFAASAAQTALSFDEKFADELLTLLYFKSRPAQGDAEDERSYLSMADYAGAIASKRPGQARIFIEREWPRRLASAQKPREDNDWEPGDDATRNLIGAMVQISPQRALQMAEQLPQGTAQTQALASWMQAVMPTKTQN